MRRSGGSSPSNLGPVSKWRAICRILDPRQRARRAGCRTRADDRSDENAAQTSIGPNPIEASRPQLILRGTGISNPFRSSGESATTSPGGGLPGHGLRRGAICSSNASLSSGSPQPPPDKLNVPRYLIRDRDTFYGAAVTRRLRAMGIRERPITPRSPWQNGHVERLIGSIRRECLDHVVVGERCLRQWPITRPTATGCARTLHSTRIPRSVDLRRQSGISHQSFGSAVSVGTTFGFDKTSRLLRCAASTASTRRPSWR